MKNKMVYKEYEKNMNVLVDSVLEAWKNNNKVKAEKLEKEIDQLVMNNPVYDEEYKRVLLEKINKKVDKYKKFNNFFRNDLIFHE